MAGTWAFCPSDHISHDRYGSEETVPRKPPRPPLGSSSRCQRPHHLRKPCDNCEWKNAFYEHQELHSLKAS